MKNLSRGLVDGGAEPHHVADDASNRAGSLDDDEQRAAGAARSALALLARRLWVGGSGGSGMVGRLTGRLRGVDSCSGGSDVSRVEPGPLGVRCVPRAHRDSMFALTNITLKGRNCPHSVASTPDRVAALWRREVAARSGGAEASTATARLGDDTCGAADRDQRGAGTPTTYPQPPAYSCPHDPSPSLCGGYRHATMSTVLGKC